MAKKITELTDATSVNDTDRLMISQDVSTTPVSRKVSASLLRSYVLQNYPEVLTANRTYYVRPDGNDNNDGLTNTPSGAFRTIQRAVNQAYTVNCNRYIITIQVADGTYNENITILGALYNSSNALAIIGNTSTPSNVIINGQITVRNGAWVVLYSMRLRLVHCGELWWYRLCPESCFWCSKRLPSCWSVWRSNICNRKLFHCR